ncbi:hypothetical protein F5Y19DRAFT_458337 [Xylariaceae sp. FL1651]|nr:hypothetical protein F5Y19DRAFT_458337 [Xylariaceae sp. FL1651]
MSSARNISQGASVKYKGKLRTSLLQNSTSPDHYESNFETKDITIILSTYQTLHTSLYQLSLTMKLLAIVFPLVSVTLVDAAAAAAAKSNTYAPGLPGSSNTKRDLGLEARTESGLELGTRALSGIVCSVNNCYVQGYSNGAAGQNELFVGSGLSPAACKAACQARAGCVSFAVQQDGSGNCYTEQHNVVAEIVENCAAPFFFYDVGCAA